MPSNSDQSTPLNPQPVRLFDGSGAGIAAPTAEDAAFGTGSGLSLIGAKATNAPATDMSAVGDVVAPSAGLDGVLFTRLRPRTPWSKTHAPAAATQATISQASAGAGLKNIMRGFMVTVIAAGAVTAETVIINIRDGATGAGTILWSMAIEVPTLAAAGAVGGSPFGMSDIYLVGSAATAMTIESSAAPGANIVVRVNAWGEVGA